MAGRLRFEQSLLPNDPIHPSHHSLDLLINAHHTFLPAGIGAQLLFPPQSPKFANGSFGLIAKPDLINKRLLPSKAFCIFTSFHAPFVFVLNLIQKFDVLVKELRLTRYALCAAIKPPE